MNRRSLVTDATTRSLLRANDNAQFSPHVLKQQRLLQQQRRTLFSSSSPSSWTRSFRFVNHRRLTKLEQDANMFPEDPRRQAALYKVRISYYSFIYLLMLDKSLLSIIKPCIRILNEKGDDVSIKIICRSG